MIKVDTRENTGNAAEWFAALDKIQPMRETVAAQEVEALRTEIETLKAKARKAPREPRPAKPLGKWARFGRFLTRGVMPWLTDRARDLALAGIVIFAFVGVFDGARYSASTFSFVGASLIAFALMPDLLMVLAGAKMRQAGITDAQWKAARSAMRFGLAFSLLTNMISAVLKSMPWLVELSTTVIGHQVRPVHLVGTVVYHAVVVLILWHAFETLSKTRSDRKGRKGSGGLDPIGALASVATGAVKSVQRKGPGAAVPAQKRGK